MQSLQSVGTDVPARLVVDRVRLYVTELMPLIAANRDHVLDVQTQYTDGLEDCVKAVFVRGIEDAIAARDVWHHDKVSQGSPLHLLICFVYLYLPAVGDQSSRTLWVLQLPYPATLLSSR